MSQRNMENGGPLPPTPIYTSTSSTSNKNAVLVENDPPPDYDYPAEISRLVYLNMRRMQDEGLAPGNAGDVEARRNQPPSRGLSRARRFWDHIKKHRSLYFMLIFFIAGAIIWTVYFCSKKGPDKRSTSVSSSRGGAVACCGLHPLGNE